MRLFFIGSLLFTPLFALSQYAFATALPVQSLIEAIQAAEGSSATLASARKIAEARSTQATQSKVEFVPKLSVTGSATRNGSESKLTIPGAPGGDGTEIVTTPQHEYDAKIRIDAPLLDLTRFRNAELASLRAETAQTGTRTQSLTVETSVSAKWLDVIRARLKREVAEKNLELARASLSSSTRRVNSGAALATDEVRSQALLAEAVANVGVADAELVSAEARLKRETGSRFSVALGFPDREFLAQVETPTLDGWIVLGVSVDPRVAEATALVAEAQAQRRVANASFYPTISAFASHNLAHSTGLATPPKNQIGLNATWGLGLADHFNRNATVILESAATDALQAAKDQNANAIVEAWHALAVAKRKLEAADAKVLSFEQDRVLREQQYRSGTSTELLYAETVTKVFEASNARAAAFIEVLSTRVALVHAAGQSVKDIMQTGGPR